MFSRSNPCKELGCHNCCKDIAIDLTIEEAERLAKAGTELEERDPWSLRNTRLVGYRIVGRCGNLDRDNSCKVHGTSQQPGECVKFELEGSKCKRLRKLER